MKVLEATPAWIMFDLYGTLYFSMMIGQGPAVWGVDYELTPSQAKLYRSQGTAYGDFLWQTRPFTPLYKTSSEIDKMMTKAIQEWRLSQQT